MIKNILECFCIHYSLCHEHSRNFMNYKFIERNCKEHSRMSICTHYSLSVCFGGESPHLLLCFLNRMAPGIPGKRLSLHPSEKSVDTQVLKNSSM